jgi:choline dehydrogenase
VTKSAHTVVLGGGTAGAAVAGLLAEHTDLGVLLVEAGPDYGPPEHWPRELLHAEHMPLGSHDWGYADTTSYPGRRVALHRARVLGGCSAINGCGVIWGHRSDYDGWAALGNPGWEAEAMLPVLRRASERLRGALGRLDELSPYHRLFLEAAGAVGVPTVADMNDLDGGEGAGVAMVNIAGGVRWNTALAYLEPVRGRPNLEILSETLVDRVLLDGARAHGVELIRGGQRLSVRAERVVVCGGAYGSPAILQRSGIGDPRMLEAAGVIARHALPGVGQNLQDHPEIDMVFGGGEALGGLMRAQWLGSRDTAVGAFAKLRSGASDAPFDLHLYPDQELQDGAWVWNYGISAQVSRSRGHLRIASADPEAAPLIHHAYLSDPEGHDLAVLANGYERLLKLVRSDPLREHLGPVQGEWAAIRTRGELESAIRRFALHTWHPVGTCRMGSEADRLAVADASGRVHGLDNVYVGDASLMPVITKGNTNLPTLAIAEKVAASLVAG